MCFGTPGNASLMILLIVIKSQWPRSVFATESISFLPPLESHYRHLGSNTESCVTWSPNIHDRSDFYTRSDSISDSSVPHSESQPSGENDVLKCCDSEQHGQFPRCIMQRLCIEWDIWAEACKEGECYKLGDGLMLTFHIDFDWLLPLDESILTTDKYLNWILSNGDADKGREEHNCA